MKKLHVNFLKENSFIKMIQSVKSIVFCYEDRITLYNPLGRELREVLLEDRL